MSSLKRSSAIALVLALAWTMVPASVSPTGSIEIDGLCASGMCQRASGSWCYDDGRFLWGWKNIIG